MLEKQSYFYVWSLAASQRGSFYGLGEGDVASTSQRRRTMMNLTLTAIGG